MKLELDRKQLLVVLVILALAASLWLSAALNHAFTDALLFSKAFVGTEVLLVSPFERQLYSGMVPGLAAGHCTAAQCAIALMPLAAAARVQWVQGAAVGLDTTARRVRLADGRSADYDMLSLDTGAVMDRDRLPGAREHGLFVRPIEHFVQLQDGLRALAAQRVPDIVVIGGGPARTMGGGMLQPHRPQQRTLNLISCGDRRAIAAWGGWSAQGRWVWWWRRTASTAASSPATARRRAAARPPATLLVRPEGDDQRRRHAAVGVARQ